MYDIGSAMVAQTLIGGLVLIVALLLVLAIFSPRRTKKYRRELADMYVAAKIRQIASKEDIDLGLEHQSYKIWVKKKSMEEGYYGFDDVVEEELKEKLLEEEVKEKPKE